MTIALVNEPEWARRDTTAGRRPAAPTPTTRAHREWSVKDYRTVPRWSVGKDADGVGLRLGCGVGAVEFQAGRGRAVLAVLAARASLGSVLELPGRPVRWVFLTSPDDPGAAVSGVAMPGARPRMTGPGALAFPPSVTARRIVPPGPGLAAPPRLHAVLSAAWQTAGCGQ